MARLKGSTVKRRANPVGCNGQRLVARERARRSTNWLHTARWQKLRLQVLVRDRYVCQQTGIPLVGGKNAPNSPVVDHKRPHRGDPDMFWDINNLQAVAKSWHDSHKQSLEKRGLA